MTPEEAWLANRHSTRICKMCKTTTEKLMKHFQVRGFNLAYLSITNFELPCRDNIKDHKASESSGVF